MNCKKPSLLVILLFILCSFAFGQQDTIKHPVTIHGNIEFTNNGISFVPAFSLGRPAVLAMFFINKNRLYFYPETDLGMDLKPWQVGYRLGYYIINKPKLIIGLGSGLGFYFNPRDSVINNEEFQIQRYTMGELNLTYVFNEKCRIQVYYFYSHRLDKIGIESGQMVMVNAVFDRLTITKKSYLTIIPSFVWLTNTAPFDGVFVSQVTSIHFFGWKPNLSLQTTLPLYTKPHSGFIWNVGLNLPF